MAKNYVVVKNGEEENVTFLMEKTYAGQNKKYLVFDGEFKCAKAETAVMRCWKAISEYMENESPAASVKAIFDNWQDLRPWLKYDDGSGRSFIPEMGKASFLRDYGLMIEAEDLDGGYYVQVTFKLNY